MSGRPFERTNAATDHRCCAQPLRTVCIQPHHRWKPGDHRPIHCHLRTNL